jgi:hypothetical protein
MLEGGCRGTAGRTCCCLGSSTRFLLRRPTRSLLPLRVFLVVAVRPCLQCCLARTVCDLPLQPPTHVIRVMGLHMLLTICSSGGSSNSRQITLAATLAQ